MRYRLPSPDRELRWYPRNAWNGWWPTGEPLAPEFDDPDEVDAIVERVRRCGTVEAGALHLAQSGDSYQQYCRDYGTHPDAGGYEYVPENVYQQRRFDRLAAKAPKVTRSEIEQEKWEAEQRERRRAQRAESDRQWREEAQRRRDEQYAAAQQQRDGWIAMFQWAIGQVTGTPQEAVMLPDLLRDIATVREHPPGPSTFHLDRGRFEAEFIRRLRQQQGHRDAA